MPIHTFFDAHTRWTSVLALAFVSAILFTGCITPTVAPTPTPTRTPKPTWTPTPSPPTSTPTPTVTPTPAFPVTIGCTQRTPDDACTRLWERVAKQPENFTWITDTTEAQVVFDVSQDGGIGRWTYAVAAPFFTVDDDVTTADLRSTWSGTPAGPFVQHPLVATTDTLDALVTLWGKPTEGAINLVAASEMLSVAEQIDAWGLLPFNRLEPEWKVLRVDGLSLLEKGKGVDTPGVYPIEVGLDITSPTRPDALGLLLHSLYTYINRAENQMAVVMMTGVTAMTRGTARLMDAKGVTYPAQDVKPWFEDADVVHISNEVSFKPDCVAAGSGTMSFCSHDDYIQLLEVLRANVIELTGNHLVDKGIEPLRHTLEMFEARGWQWFGGGKDYTDARQPALFEFEPNKIAFIGCNSVDNPYDWATDTLPGVFSCRELNRKAIDPEDLAYLEITIADLRAQGYNVVFTVQEYETESYTPFSGQIVDFRTFADLGPVYVQGSQAHQPQTMEFYNDTFIHYGLGNFLFDQMWPAGQQGFVNRLVFQDNRLLSIELRTTWIEEYGRPRPMVAGDPNPAADRAQFLQMIFDLSPGQ